MYNLFRHKSQLHPLIFRIFLHFKDTQGEPFLLWLLPAEPFIVTLFVADSYEISLELFRSPNAVP